MDGLNMNGSSVQTVDYDLHGLAGVRLIDATPNDAAVVTNQLGPIQKPLTREPDITIRFVDRLEVSSPVKYIGLNDVAFTDDKFLVLRSKHKAKAKVHIPFDRIGRHCEIICQRGVPAVPLLIAIVNVVALSNGAVPMHASAFRYNGTGVLVTGWAKGGKTETLLAFIARGAEYVGDEWIYLCDDNRMYGIPEPIRLWYWHLKEMPEFKEAAGRLDIARLRALGLVVGTMDRILAGGIGDGTPPMRLMRRALPILRRQQSVQLAPERLFGEAVGPLSERLDKVFFVASHSSDEITVAPADPEAIARRMVFSLEEERDEFLSYYLKYRFAFPECRNELIERTEEIQREALLRILADKETYEVYHPYPVSIPALYDAISPLL